MHCDRYGSVHAHALKPSIPGVKLYSNCHLPLSCKCTITSAVYHAECTVTLTIFKGAEELLMIFLEVVDNLVSCFTSQSNNAGC